MPLQIDDLELYAVPGEHSIIDTIHPDTGLSCICGETYEQIKARYPTAQRYSWEVWQREQIDRQNTPIRWVRCDRAEYQRMLEVLPPALWEGGAFLVGEPHDHSYETGQPRFAAYRLQGTCTFPSYWRASRPLTARELRTAIGRPPSDQIDYLS